MISVTKPTDGSEDFFELIFDHRELPENLDPSRKALFLSGNNHSDDLFMFLKRQITGLEPDTAYLVDLEVEIASEAVLRLLRSRQMRR